MIAFYRVEYSEDNTEGIENYLFAHPAELPDFQDSTMQTILGMMSWGDYKTPLEAFALMIAVIAHVRLRRGEDVIAFDDPSPSPWRKKVEVKKETSKITHDKEP